MKNPIKWLWGPIALISLIVAVFGFNNYDDNEVLSALKQTQYTKANTETDVPKEKATPVASSEDNSSAVSSIEQGKLTDEALMQFVRDQIAQKGSGVFLTEVLPKIVMEASKQVRADNGKDPTPADLAREYSELGKMASIRAGMKEFEKWSAEDPEASMLGALAYYRKYPEEGRSAFMRTLQLRYRADKAGLMEWFTTVSEMDDREAVESMFFTAYAAEASPDIESLDPNHPYLKEMVTTMGVFMDEKRLRRFAEATPNKRVADAIRALLKDRKVSE